MASVARAAPNAKPSCLAPATHCQLSVLLGRILELRHVISARRPPVVPAARKVSKRVVLALLLSVPVLRQAASIRRARASAEAPKPRRLLAHGEGTARCRDVATRGMEMPHPEDGFEECARVVCNNRATWARGVDGGVEVDRDVWVAMV